MQKTLDSILEHVGPHLRVEEREESEEDFNIIVYPPSIGTVQEELCNAERALDDIEAEMVSVEVVERMLHRIHAATEKESS